MLRHLHAITAKRDFWTYLVLAVVSATLQRRASWCCSPWQIPVRRLPGQRRPVGGGAAGVDRRGLGMDVLTARRGLRLGVSMMRTIQQRTPGAVLAWPDVTPQRAAALRT